MTRTLLRFAASLLALALLASAFGSDGDDSSGTADTSDESTTTSATGATSETSNDADNDGTTSSSTTSTTVVGETTTTTEAPTDGAGVLAEGSVTTNGGLTSNWSLTATATSLCFVADLTHPDADIAAAAGDGVSDCLEPVGGLDSMSSGLSVDVGAVDGERTIGFLWGRVAPEVIGLTIEHVDGSQTPIEILQGATEVGVFAFVVEIASIAEVQDLDAVSGTQIEGSAPIRDFLRAGPTYPVTTPPSTTPPPDYPVS